MTVKEFCSLNFGDRFTLQIDRTGNPDNGKILFEKVKAHTLINSIFADEKIKLFICSTVELEVIIIYI